MCTSMDRETFDGLGEDVHVGESPALLLVDIQNGMTDPDHPVGAEMDDMIDANNRLIGAARSADVPIVFTILSYDHPDDTGGPFQEKAPELRSFSAESRWTNLDPRIDRRDADIVIDTKRHQSAFFGTDLDYKLRNLGVDTLVVTGCSTSGCVRATVTDASAHGYRPFVPREAVADRSERQHEANLVDMDLKLANVVSLEEIIDELDSVD